MADPVVAKGEGVRRLDFLDTLRGLAAIYVIAFHMVNVPKPHLMTPYWATSIVGLGGSGVVLFFVVSAFSLFYTMPLRFRDQRPWLSFFIHRFFRIAPLFYLWIGLSLLRDYFVYDKTNTVANVVASITFAFNVVPGHQLGIVAASGTIGVEMLFYLMFPVVFYVARDKWRAVALFFGLMAFWTAVKALAIYVSDDSAVRTEFLHWFCLNFFPIFACGAIAFHALMAFENKAKQPGAVDNSSIGAALVMAFFAGATAMLSGWMPNIFGNWIYYEGVLYTLLVVGLGLWPVRVIVNRVTVYLGKISYSVYLTHPTVVFFLTPVYLRIYANVPNLSLAYLASAALTLAVVIPLSELTFRFVETPGMRLGKRVQAVLSPRRVIIPAETTKANAPRGAAMANNEIASIVN